MASLDQATFVISTSIVIYFFFSIHAFQVGIYVAVVRKQHIICAILAPIPCARVVLKMLIILMLEEIMDFVGRA